MLTEKKKRFADYYIISLNATDAARKAGYISKRPDGLKKKGYQLKNDNEIKAYIEKSLKSKKDGLIVEQDEILKYLSGCILGTETETQVITLKSGSNGCFDESLEKIEVPLKARDRIKSAEIMAKIYKLMDKVENNEPQKVIIECDIPLKNGTPNE